MMLMQMHFWRSRFCVGQSVHGSLTGPTDEAARLGAELAARMLAQGAAALMTAVQVGDSQ